MNTDKHGSVFICVHRWLHFVQFILCLGGEKDARSRSRARVYPELLHGVAPIEAVRSAKQLLVSALLENSPVLEDHDEIRIFEGGQSVGNDQRRALLKQALQRILDELFRLGIEGR